MLQVNERLGDFQIIRLLGKGGMGEVYEARQLNPERRVALKVLIPWLARDEDALQRFWREAQVPANLDHPGIVRIISTGKTEDGVAYYTMHLVRGITLAELIRCGHDAPGATISQQSRDQDTPSQAAPTAAAGADRATPFQVGSLPPVFKEYVRDCFLTLARIGAQAARALAFAHQQGFLHRDIKPSNLMVDHHNQVYLVDFGLTRALEPDGPGTLPGVLTGTPWYMSPEQADGKPLDARSDIYSLGVTLYELATLGLGPFSASRQNKEAVLGQVRTGQVLPLRSLAPAIPPTLEKIIARAMHYRPKHRYEDAAAMALALEKFLEENVRKAPPAPAGPRWLARASLGLLLFIALVVVGWVFLGNRMLPSPVAEPVQPALPGTIPKTVPGKNPVPALLLHRQPRQWINLFTTNPVGPIWSEQLADPGILFRRPDLLHLAAKKKGSTFLLALDHDPEERGFEFSVELKPILSKQAGENQLGAFVGWHAPSESDPGRLNPYLAISLHKKNARFQVLCIYQGKALQEGEGNVGGILALPDENDKLVLARPGPWHLLRIIVAAKRVTITADDTHTAELDLDQLKRLNPVFGYLNPRGCLGIWTNGDADFRNAQVMTVP